MPVKLNVVYSAAEEIPEGFAELYTERDGKFVLTAVEGVKTQADIDRINEGLRKERADHKATKDRLAAFGELDPAVIPQQLTELEELRARAEAGDLSDPSKLEPVIEARVKRAVGPVERQLSQIQRDLDNARKTVAEKDQEVGALKNTITRTGIERELRDAAVASKVLGEAVGDAVVIGLNVFEVAEDGRILTKEMPGVVPGLSPKDWLKDQQAARPYWWPASVGGGAGAGGRGGLPQRADNPWTKEGWNITKQAQFVRANGEAKAMEAARAAGLSTLTATKPAAA